MASDLIYREDAKNFVRHAYNKGLNPMEYIDEIPAADVRPVIAAAWNDNGNGTVSCSRCQTWFPKERLPYMRICGYCGADMRKVVEIDQVKEGAK